MLNIINHILTGKYVYMYVSQYRISISASWGNLDTLNFDIIAFQMYYGFHIKIYH